MPRLQTIKEFPTAKLDDGDIRMDFGVRGRALNPSWFEEGFVNESWSMQAESFQEQESLFLISGREPQVGMRTETNILVNDGSWFRLSGIVSSIDLQPTDAELDESNSSNWNNHEFVCCHEDCPFITGSPEEKKHEMIQRYGALHGQRIQSLAILNNDFRDYFQRPIDDNQVVLLDLVCDDKKHNIWQVQGISMVGDTEKESLPTYFLHFTDMFEKGKSCKCFECAAMLEKVCAGAGVNSCNCTKCRVDEKPRRNPVRRARDSRD